MSRNIVIKNGCLLKSKVSKSSLMGESKYSIGYLDDNFRATDDESEACHCILYDRNNIGRGVQLIGLDEKKSMSLALSMPCTAEDVQMLYETAARVAALWKTTSVMIDDEMVDVSELQQYAERDLSLNIKMLKDPSPYAHDGYATLYGAICPICVSTDQFKSFGDDYASFSTFLNDRQQIDAFYSCPYYFKQEEELVAMYVVIEDGYLVLPNRPKTIINCADCVKECDRVIIAISDLLPGESTSTMDYNVFVSRLSHDMVSVFDCQHLLIRPLSKEELIEIFGTC